MPTHDPDTGGDAAPGGEDAFAQLGEQLSAAARAAEQLSSTVAARTVNAHPDVDEDAFFTAADGSTTLVTRYDLEKTIPDARKSELVEIDRYWLNKPFAFAWIGKNRRDNTPQYYVVEPHLTPAERELRAFLTDKLQDTITYDTGSDTAASADAATGSDDVTERAAVIDEHATDLLARYNLLDADAADTNTLHTTAAAGGDADAAEHNGRDDEQGFIDAVRAAAPFLSAEHDGHGGGAAPVTTRGDMRSDTSIYASAEHIPDPPSAPPRVTRSASSSAAQRAVDSMLPRNVDLSEYHARKLLYYLKREYIGYAKIDALKHDINIEDISCDGYNEPVFVYHTEYENIITNIEYTEEDALDEFVVNLAQRSGKGISKRDPQVDATLPDGSRAQLTLGEGVSDHGTNYTIRQFKDVPFTPVDLVNWNTFSLAEMAYLWLCIENRKNLLVAGGTATGKTTALNAVSLFIPSTSKIVSIEDTREVKLPQRNWIASVTRDSFSDDGSGDIDEFDLLEAALRQRPDYVVFGEVRGEEGRTLFQVMNTGHTTLTTFHANSVQEVINRFTTDPINVSKTLFDALDLVAIQRLARLDGQKLRRNDTLAELRDLDADTGDLHFHDAFTWRADGDEFEFRGGVGAEVLSSTDEGEAETETEAETEAEAEYDGNTAREKDGVLADICDERGWTRDDLRRALLERQAVLAYLIDNDINAYADVAATIQGYLADEDAVLALIANNALEDRLDDLRSISTLSIDIDPEKEEMTPRPDPGDATQRDAAATLTAAEDILNEYTAQDAEASVEALRRAARERDTAAAAWDEAPRAATPDATAGDDA